VAGTYEIVTRNGAGGERVRHYTSEDGLAPGSVVALGGRYWLVEHVAEGRVHAVPARYRALPPDLDARSVADRVPVAPVL